MASEMVGNPWKGLNFYKEGEIIYGRNSEIQSLSQYIFNNTQTVLYGRSGIGKSSILNAGIFPKARLAGMIPVSIRLNHDDDDEYLSQIRAAIENSGLIPKPIIPAVNGVNDKSLWEFMHRHEFLDDNDNKQTPLLVFDQFEEIFTLQRDENKKKDFFKQLGDLLNDVKPGYIVEYENQNRQRQTVLQETKVVSSGAFKGLSLKLNKRRNNDNPQSIVRYIEYPDYHIVFAMREDFLSSLELYASSIPVMKDNRFGLLPINEEQAADIIRLPREGLIDNDVTKLIIQQVTGREDFELDGIPEIEVDAAVLSLFLSRLYVKKPESESQITSELVKTYSGHIIHDFYVDSIASNEQEHEFLTAHTILLLEDQLLTREGRRNNVSRNDLIAQGVKEEELSILIYKRKLLRQFYHGNDIRIEFIHDILCPVVKERKEQREQLRRQEEERRRQEKETQRVIAAEQKKREELERKNREEKAQMEAEAIRVKRRNRNRLLGLSSVIAFILTCTGIYYYCFGAPYSEYYGNFTTRNGWPVGLGDQLHLSKEKEKCTLYYKLSRSGRLSSFMGELRHFTKVEVLNWKGEPATNAFVESPVVRIIDRELDNVKAAEFANLISNVYYWQYTPDANGSISMKTAFDINGKELYSEKYSSTNNDGQYSKYVLWCVFYDNNGNLLQVNDNGTDRIRYTIDDGYITGCSFFTILGTPQPNTSGDYGYSYGYETDSTNAKIISAQVISQCVTDKFGDKIDSTLIHFSTFENGRYAKTDICSIQYLNRNVLWKYKNRTDSMHIREDGFVDYLKKTIDKNKYVRIRYKSKDEILRKMIFSCDTLCYSAKYYYSSKLDSVKIYDAHYISPRYTMIYSYQQKNMTKLSYWSNGRKLSLPIGYDGIECHEVVTEKHTKDKECSVTTSYYDSEGMLTKVGRYSKSKIISDVKTGNHLFEYYFDSKGDICKSEMFSYNEYGIRESRAVVGIDKTPVRCPNWDWDGFAYYKMKYLKDCYGQIFVNIMGINEFGERSYVFYKDNEVFVTEQPLVENKNQKTDSVVISNYSLSKASLITLRNKFKVPFLHLLNPKSILYKAYGNKSQFWRDGLFDNDIIYHVGGWKIGDNPQKLNQELAAIEAKGGTVQILRVVDKKYKLLRFSVRPGPLYAEIHFLSLTDHELNRIKSVKL